MLSRCTALSHVGSYRVFARMMCGAGAGTAQAGTVSVRLEWRPSAAGRYAANDATSDAEQATLNDAVALWMGGARSVTVTFAGSARPLSVRVDAFDCAWPDHFGDPKRQAGLFGAWLFGVVARGA